MEASVLSQPAGITPLAVRAPLRRLRGDERLIALIRAGDVAAFEALVNRYRSRLLAFCAHMLRSREDAEDVLQEVFAAAYRAIVADQREINVRPWLYRIARNMCLKHMARRRPATDGGVEELELASGSSTLDAVGLREDLRQVVDDVRELPETQRTALLLREIDGLSYDQIAQAMDTTVPGVKSLLVRARVSLAETAEGRLLSCDVVHLELRHAAAHHLRLSGAARRHAQTCEICAAYRSELGVARRAAAFWPLAPVALVRELLAKLGLGAGAGASAAGAGAAVGGGAAAGACSVCGTAVSTTLGAIGGKAVAVVATAGLVAAGAANIDHHSSRPVHHAASPAAAPVRQTDLPARAPASTVWQPAPNLKPKDGVKDGARTRPKDVAGSPGALPSMPADGSLAAGTPTTPVTPTGNGGTGAPADPATQQPIGNTDPTQSQGVKEQSQAPVQQTPTSGQSSTSDSTQTGTSASSVSSSTP